MYSLTISFGPAATTWAFLFKEENTARNARVLASSNPEHATHFSVNDDFGQWGSFAFSSVHAILLEDLDLTEEARIQRSIAEAHVRVKVDQRAKSDPVIRAAMNQAGPAILQPVPNRFSN